MKTDARGLAVADAAPLALDLYEMSLRAFQTYRGDPIAPLDEAIAHSPGFVAARAAKALVLLVGFERRFTTEARAVLEAAEPHLSEATPRERDLVAAGRLLAAGDWHGGVAALDRILVEHPRDILALQVAHLFDFARGDALNLRNRVSRVLPQWSRAYPGNAFVLGMQAFGFEECNQYPEAEAAGLKALSAEPEDCWAVHAVTHVYEMQGRIENGIAFLKATQAQWAAPDNGFAFHNWWHLALFHLDQADYAGALRVYDQALAGALGMVMSRIDATALLWRFLLEGVDVGARFEAVADAWAADLDREGGYYAFNDFHAALAFAATGREASLAELRKALEDSAWERGANGDMARAVGIDATEGVIAFAERRDAAAVELLLAVRDGATRFGGSHAQRDLLTLTLVEAARRAGQPRVSAHFAAERTVHRPRSAWGSRLLERLHSPQPRSPRPLPAVA